jgi:drug/metabolite transporter (DMT)-like permease
MTGVALGLLMALFQSLSYLCSRAFLRKYEGGIVKLFCLAHIVMGVACVPVVVFMRPTEMPAVSSYIASLLSCSGFYLTGQLFFFAAIAHAEPSRVSPILGLKVLILAVISSMFLGHSFNATKWTAVGLSLVAILLLSNSGGKMGLRPLLYAAFACLGYSLSDLNVKILVDKFSFMDLFDRAILTGCMCFSLCGLVGLIALPFSPGKTSRTTWAYVIPFAATWLISVMFLFSCFSLVGVVFGNILQSTRGIISIVLGYVIAHAGFETWEAKVSKRVLLQRLLAALLMTMAVGLFLI